MASVTDSSSSPELAAALHRLRSTLARMRAELELVDGDASDVPLERLVGDLRQALEALGDVESAALRVVRVLVVDDDERLAELTARGLRRMGYDAETSPVVRPFRAGEVVVVDLGVVETLDPGGQMALRSVRPIIMTGATDARSRALAAELDASDYLVKPVEPAQLDAAIKRVVAERS